MLKVVSVALFGEGHEKYAQYLPAFVIGTLNLFPLDEGWLVRVYVDPIVAASKYGRFLLLLHQEGLIYLQGMGPAPLTKAMLWRLAPVFDPSVDFVFCRDLDAAPMPRDRACCDAFVRSGCHVHTVHDNVAHEGIMGGLCGFRAREFRRVTGWESLDDLYRAAGQVDYTRHGTDQIALNDLLLSARGPLLLEHRYAGWAGGRPGVNPPREAGKYMCEAFSTPVPDEGSREIDPGIRAEADRLGAHLGCACYDHQAAIEFWHRCGRRPVSLGVAMSAVRAGIEQSALAEILSGKP